MWETHPQDTKRTELAHNQHKHKGRSRLVVEAEMGGGDVLRGQHIFILMHFKVCSYASLLGFLVLIKSYAHRSYESKGLVLMLLMVV